MTSRRQRPPVEHTALPVSVVVPAYNAARSLGCCLDALLASDPAPLEIIVVDDGSTDDTAAIAAARGCRVERLAQQGGPARARNRGVALARGELLLMVDADVVLQPGTLGALVGLLTASPELAGVSAIYAIPRGGSFGSRYLTLKQRYFQLGLPADADTAYTACFATRRACFESSGGFDEAQQRAAADDLVLGDRYRRAGLPMAIAHEHEVEHLEDKTALTTMRYHYMHAREWFVASRRHRGLEGQMTAHSRRPMVNTLLAGGLLTGGVCSVATLPIPPLSVGFAAGNAVLLATFVAWNSAFLGWLARTQGRRFAVACLPVVLGESVANVALIVGPPPAASVDTGRRHGSIGR